jgi:hypothetical protein
MTDEAIVHEHVMETGARVAEIFKELLRQTVSDLNRRDAETLRG